MTGEAGATTIEIAAAQVRQLIDRYAAAWNASDMDAMAQLYTDDVHWVNIVGMHWQGKAQVDRGVASELSSSRITPFQTVRPPLRRVRPAYFATSIA